jgi:hypothetical protein
MAAIEAALPIFISQNESMAANYVVDPRSGIKHLTIRPSRNG